MIDDTVVVRVEPARRGDTKYDGVVPCTTRAKATSARPGSAPLGCLKDPGQTRAELTSYRSRYGRHCSLRGLPISCHYSGSPSCRIIVFVLGTAVYRDKVGTVDHDRQLRAAEGDDAKSGGDLALTDDPADLAATADNVFARRWFRRSA